MDLQGSNKRDMTLINILERMVEQIHVQDSLIKELIDRQGKVSDATENSIFHQNLLRDEIDEGLNKLHDSFNRYRTDMLTFVQEQDILRQNMEDALEKTSKISFSLEEEGKIVTALEKGFTKHEKDVHDHIEFATEQWDNLPDKFVETNRNIKQVNEDLEKQFSLLNFPRTTRIYPAPALSLIPRSSAQGPGSSIAQ
jgi:hypothetical protein